MPFLILDAILLVQVPGVHRSKSRRSPSVRMKRKWPWKGKSTWAKNLPLCVCVSVAVPGRLQPSKSEVLDYPFTRAKKQKDDRNKTIVYSIPEGTELLTVEGSAGVGRGAVSGRFTVHSVGRDHVQLGHNHGEKVKKRNIYSANSDLPKRFSNPLLTESWGRALGTFFGVPNVVQVFCEHLWLSVIR